MSDGTGTYALSDLAGAGADRPVDERGELDVRGRAIEHIACNVSRHVPGLVPHAAGGVGPLTGSAYPSARASVSGPYVSVALDVAATWPCRVTELAGTVRDTVRAETARLSATEIDRVDVTIHLVTTANATTNSTTTTQRRVR